MSATVNLTGHFLIAMPNMSDPNFAHSLTYICEHNEQGALGLIVNRPLEMALPALFERVNIAPASRRFEMMPVYFGGPVQTDRGFVLHRPIGDWQATLAVGGEVGLTSSRDILQSVAERGEPSEILVALGYAGWAAGQLEWELTQNAWLTVVANPDIVFALPAEERLPAAMQRLGVDFTRLSDVAGHA
ncbi:MAG: YqgE/AlgH family protein [Rhodocyclaceae bacterium]